MSSNENSEHPTQNQTASGEDRRFFGQPLALASVFNVELWERFSFYGMQGILAIYLYYSASQGGLGVSQQVALGIVGAYGGLVYLSAIVGAWLADRVFGPERLLTIAAIVIMIGHLALALLPGVAGIIVGLLLVALGSGGLKANASSLVGSLYSREDPRRDAGFSLFYLGVNLGGLIGPILTGLAQVTWGFHFGFGLAAVGMGIGLTVYLFGRKNLPEKANHIADPLSDAERRRWIIIAIAAVAVIVVLVLVGAITAINIAAIITGLTLVAAISYFIVILRSPKITPIERRRVFGFIPLFLGSVVFWSLYQQQFTVLTAYSDQRLDRNLFGWEMPVSWVQSINPVFIIILSGVFAALWTKLGNRQPSTPVKFGLSVIGMGVAFLLFLPMAGGGPGSAPLLALVGILFVFTLSELLLSPVGLSVSTKLAPEAFQTQMLALFYLSVALGSSISGILAQYYSADTEGMYFGVLGVVSLIAGVILLCLRKPVLALMSGIR